MTNACGQALQEGGPQPISGRDDSGCRSLRQGYFYLFTWYE